ncbi:MAG: hypothetical protein ABIN91_17990 [Mucilaginibacter sp.]|uniref:hypothetical protein n=1 Tax=Mucilaginibacter sp. TaxID=1882438 RepID=UPI003263B8DA
MKTKLYLILTLVILLTSCSKEIVSTSGLTYDQSLKKWIAYKASVNNNYSYTVVSGSVFGFGSSTKIIVQGGKITARDYIATRRINNGPLETYKTWSETAANLNTHNLEGADLLTLDDIYTKAKNEWLTVDKEKNTIYFETDDKGLLSSCGHVPEGCQDDCFMGITIKEIVGL